jgi:hypothetical protein
VEVAEARAVLGKADSVSSEIVPLDRARPRLVVRALRTWVWRATHTNRNFARAARMAPDPTVRASVWIGAPFQDRAL